MQITLSQNKILANNSREETSEVVERRLMRNTSFLTTEAGTYMMAHNGI